MSKRTAAKELTHDNWETEEEHEEMGQFRQASDEQLAGRSIKKAKRRGTNGETGGGPSVFKGLSVFSSFSSPSASSAPPAFSFLNSVSKDSPGISFGKFNSNTKSETTSEKTTQPLKVTQDSVLPSVKAAEPKANGFLESKEEGEGEEKRDANFLRNLMALNKGVLVWIQKHLDKNPHVNLTPVFDDYKKHFSELVKKHPPELGASKDSESGSAANGSRKDSASGKENTPVEAAAVKPFTFGLQTSAPEKSSDSVKSIFTFGQTSSDTEKKPESTPTFSFSGFSSNSQKPEGLVFGNSNSSSNSTSNLFSGFNSSPPAKTSGFNSSPPAKTSGTFSFASGSSATVTEKKESGDKTEEPSDEPPKVEVEVVKEDDALYEKKCKLFYMKEGAYVDRGVGTVYLKAVGEKTQLLVRAYTNLGNILLNIILNASVPAVRAGKNGVMIVCVPNPPLETNAEKSKEPVKMLIRVKTSEDADTLLGKIEEYKK